VRLLPKQIWKEEFNYYSDKSVEGLKKDIKQLFEGKKLKNYSVNLTGEFTSEFEFKMTPKWQLVNIKNFERELSYLNGNIFADEFKRTRVIFTVRPNSIFMIFFFGFPFFGLIGLTDGNLNSEFDETRIIGLVFTFAVPTLMLLFGHLAKQGIKNNFINALNLKPIE